MLYVVPYDRLQNTDRREEHKKRGTDDVGFGIRAVHHTHTHTYRTQTHRAKEKEKKNLSCG